MQSVLLNIKTNPKTKQALKKFASELGVTSTALVNLLIKQALRDRTITVSSDKKAVSKPEKKVHNKDSQIRTDKKFEYFEKHSK